MFVFRWKFHVTDDSTEHIKFQFLPYQLPPSNCHHLVKNNLSYHAFLCDVLKHRSLTIQYITNNIKRSFIYLCKYHCFYHFHRYHHFHHFHLFHRFYFIHWNEILVTVVITRLCEPCCEKKRINQSIMQIWNNMPGLDVLMKNFMFLLF